MRNLEVSDMKNTSFNKILSKSKKSMYEVSTKTGIPYTTINRLKHNSLDINHCSYDTVARLAAYFSCNVDDIANPVQFMNNVSGIYKKIKYHWKINDNNEAECHIEEPERGDDIVLYKSPYLNKRRLYKVYQIRAEDIIDVYLRQHAAEEMLCRCTH